jgi:hypothetical protein
VSDTIARLFDQEACGGVMERAERGLSQLAGFQLLTLDVDLKAAGFASNRWRSVEAGENAKGLQEVLQYLQSSEVVEEIPIEVGGEVEFVSSSYL